MQNKKPKCYLPHEYIYNSSGSKHSFYKTMFIEDIMNKIIPISLERNKDDCKAVLDCKENDFILIKNIQKIKKRLIMKQTLIIFILLSRLQIPPS